MSSDWDLECVEARSTFNKHLTKCRECAIWNNFSGEEAQDCSYTCNDNENIFFSLSSPFVILFLSIFNLDILKHRLLLNDLFLDIHSVLLYLNAATYIHSVSSVTRVVRTSIVSSKSKQLKLVQFSLCWCPFRHKNRIHRS